MYSEQLREKRQLVWPETGGVFGEANVALTADLVMRLGQAIAYVCAESRAQRKIDGPSQIVIGKDTRQCNYTFQSALEAGLTSMGAAVHLTGPLPTPALVRLTMGALNADRGIMISGKEGPSFWSGFEMFSGEGTLVPRTEWERIREMIEATEATIEQCMSFPLPEAGIMGKAENADFLVQRYLEFLRGKLSDDVSFQGLRVVLDCANGSVYRIAPQLLRPLGVEVFPLNIDPNGRNINPLPLEHDKVDPVAQEVRRVRADAGVSISADGVTARIFDEKGTLLDDSIVLVLLRLYQKQAREEREERFRLMKEVEAGLIPPKGVSKHPAVPSNAMLDGASEIIEMMASGDSRGVVYQGEGRFVFPHVLLVPDGLLTVLYVLAIRSEDKGQEKPRPLSAIVRAAVQITSGDDMRHFASQARTT